ncbi:MAG: hypothetical protein J2P36_24860, partial [Ktedonobacteraceae bacterium]|nr:hypothetical protein [Ktedonobacteraceae bacterium]
MSELGHTGASDQSQAGDATTSSDQGGLNLSKPLVAGGLTVAALAGFAGGYGVKDAVDHHDTRPEQVQHEPNASRTMLADLNFSVGNKRVEVTGWKGANGDVEVSTGGDPSAGKLVTELYGQGGEKVGKAEVTPGENAQLALGKDNTPDNQLGVWKENGLPDFLVSLPRDGIEKNTGFGVIMSAGDGNNKLIDVDAVRGSDNTLSI